MAVQEIAVSCVSICLYSSLGFVSLWMYYRIYRKFKRGSNEFYNVYPLEKYDKMRMLFFGVLGLSSFLETPLYIACLANGGHEACAWHGSSYSIVWMCHLFALLGYFLCLGMPLILWSNMLRGKDATTLFPKSLSDLDVSTVCLYVSFSVYLGIIITEFVCVALKFDNSSSFRNDSTAARVRAAESVFYAIVACAWVLYGVRLIYLLPIVKGSNNGLGRLLIIANVYMVVIFFSYVLRAILIMTQSLKLFGKVGEDTFIHDHFAFWTIGTRWLPYIICSMLLIAIMNSTNRSRNADSKANKGMYAPFSTSDHSRESDDVLINRPDVVQTIYYDGAVSYN